MAIPSVEIGKKSVSPSVAAQFPSMFEVKNEQRVRKKFNLLRRRRVVLGLEKEGGINVVLRSHNTRR